MRSTLSIVLVLIGLAACQSRSPVATPSSTASAPDAATAAADAGLEPGTRVVYADGSTVVREESIEEDANTMRALISVPGMT